MYNNVKSVSVESFTLCKGDFEKARKYDQMKKNFSGIEKEHYDNLLRLNHCIETGVDIPNDCVSKLEKCLSHFQKNKHQYIAIGTLTIAILSASLMFAPAPVSTVTVACASGMPTVNMGTITAMLNKLITNLIKLGALFVSASCVIDMIKSVVQGNVSHLPKSLITHGLMVCSLFVSPMVFEAISKAFGV